MGYVQDDIKPVKYKGALFRAEFQAEDGNNWEALSLSPTLMKPFYVEEEWHEFVRGKREDSFCMVVKSKDADPLSALIADLKNFITWLEECRDESRENIRKS